jgi:PAS domain S-box-containing protein
MTKEYENAIAMYYSKLRIRTIPLISWDLFTTHPNEASTFNTIQKNWNSKDVFYEVVIQSKKIIIVTNANYEIIFASDNITKMNGYSPKEVIGASPKMFQGKLTTNDSISNIRKAILNKLPFKEIILNYRKDGTVYCCEIEAYPKFDAKGNLINYIAFEKLAS